MEITKERLLEIASMSDNVLSDGRIISPDAYQSVTSIEITTMARMLLCYIGKGNKNQIDSNVNIHDVLEGWGAWAAAGNSSVDWQSVADKYRGTVSHGKKLLHPCTDDEGRVIDASVLRLKKYKPHKYELIVSHFVMGISLRSISRIKGCSDGTIRKEMQLATGFIFGVISFYNHTNTLHKFGYIF